MKNTKKTLRFNSIPFNFICIAPYYNKVSQGTLHEINHLIVTEMNHNDNLLPLVLLSGSVFMVSVETAAFPSLA